MNKVKSKIRYLLGYFILSLRLSSLFKLVLLNLTKVQFYFFLPPYVTFYFRRSITTKFFIPFWSDIDVTFFVTTSTALELNQAIERLILIRKWNPFVKDIEIVDDIFYDDWLDHGGFKNWKKNLWSPENNASTLKEIDISNLSKEEIYYNLIWEHRFLYAQFAKNINKFFSGEYLQVDLINSYKIVADVENLMIFSTSKDTAIRNDILSRYPLYKKALKINLSKKEYEEHFHFLIEKFSHLTNDFVFKAQIFFNSSLSLSPINFSIELYRPAKKISFFHFPVFFVDHFSLKVFKEHHSASENILFTPKLYQLYRLCGAQEIAPLLALSRTEKFQFLKKYITCRLLQDYLQAITEEQSEIVLFYCRQNIDQFFYTHLASNEALTYAKLLKETHLEHYARVRDKIVLI